MPLSCPSVLHLQSSNRIPSSGRPARGQVTNLEARTQGVKLTSEDMNVDFISERAYFGQSVLVLGAQLWPEKDKVSSDLMSFVFLCRGTATVGDNNHAPCEDFYWYCDLLCCLVHCWL